MVGVIPFDSTLFTCGMAAVGSTSTAPPVEADSSPGTLILHSDQSQEPVPLTHPISFELQRQTPTHLPLWSKHDHMEASGQIYWQTFKKKKKAKQGITQCLMNKAQLKDISQCKWRKEGILAKETLAYILIKMITINKIRFLTQPSSVATQLTLDVFSLCS